MKMQGIIFIGKCVTIIIIAIAYVLKNLLGVKFIFTAIVLMPQKLPIL